MLHVPIQTLGTGARDLNPSVRITGIATLFHKYFSVQSVLSRCVINWRTHFLKLNKPSTKSTLVPLISQNQLSRKQSTKHYNQIQFHANI